MVDIIKILQVVFWPAAVALIGFFLIRLIKTLDKVDESTGRLDKTVSNLALEQKNFREACVKTEVTTEKRLDAHAGQLDNHEVRIVTLETKGRGKTK